MASGKDVIKGIGASYGIAKGHAIVAEDADEFMQKYSKFSTQNEKVVIVTSMTSPDWFHIVKRYACAIVTDEGGLLCHAATLAREMGIPAVVGTKIATQIIKDYDMIEVDGYTGVVKIL